MQPEEGRAVQTAFKMRATGDSHGRIARWLNDEGFEPRGKNRTFTPFAVKDMLNNRFYLGVVRYRGEEFAGQHEALIEADLFEPVQARRGGERAPRSAFGAHGVLRGRVSCGRCGSRLHSERDRHQVPRYRERHGLPCSTNGRSLIAQRVDEQIGEIWKAVEFEPDWRDRIAEIASASYEGPSLASLNERRRRLARAYADGAFSDEEYTDLKSAVEGQARAAQRVTGPSYQEAAEILGDMPSVWERAQVDERRLLLAPLIERLYVDLECGLIGGGLQPTPAFRGLLEHALRRSTTSTAVLLTPEETRGVMSGLGMVETGEN